MISTVTLSLSGKKQYNRATRLAAWSQEFERGITLENLTLLLPARYAETLGNWVLRGAFPGDEHPIVLHWKYYDCEYCRIRQFATCQGHTSNYYAISYNDACKKLRHLARFQILDTESFLSLEGFYLRGWRRDAGKKAFPAFPAE